MGKTIIGGMPLGKKWGCGKGRTRVALYSGLPASTQNETQHIVNLGQKTAIFDPLKLSTKKKYHQNGFETGETTLVSQKLTKIKFETTLVSQKKTFF